MYAEKPMTAREDTLNERLNRACAALHHCCDRLEGFLSRVNSTPQKLEGVKGGDAPRPTIGLAATVESIEAIQQRLAELASGVERVA